MQFKMVRRDPMQKIFLRYCKACKTKGLNIREGEAPMAFFNRTASHFSDASDSILGFSVAYLTRLYELPQKPNIKTLRSQLLKVTQRIKGSKNISSTT